MDKKTVLFVDDNRSILMTLQAGLFTEPYDQLFAESGRRALQIMETQPVHVIVTDMKMPGMDGLELLRIVKERWPLTVRMILSGYSQVSMLMLAINQGNIYKYILKPWNLDDELKGAINDALNFYDTQSPNETCTTQSEN